MRSVVLSFVVMSSFGCGTNSARLWEVGLEDGTSEESAGLLSLKDARIIEVPESDLTLAVWENRLGPERKDSAFSLKSGGSDFSLAKRTRFDLVFRGEVFDPKTALRPATEASLYVVQFYGPALSEFIRGLERAGAQPLHSFPRNAYVVRLDDSARANVQALPYVRAIEPFEARHRLDVSAFNQLRRNRYFVMPASQNAELKGALAAAIEGLGGQVHEETLSHYLLEVTLDGEQLHRAAELAEVLHIDAYAEPSADMDKVRAISGANFIEQTLGFTGQGVRGEVMDGNVFDAHSDLKNRNILFHGTHSGDDSHGTSTTGIVFGDGTGNPVARGLLPTGQPIFADYDNFNGTGDRKAHTAELKSAPYNAVFQSNSWGSSLTTEYTTISAQMDSIIFDLDFLIFNSQSNSGSRSSRPEAWAKNVVSIGGVKHFDTLDTADDRWASGGSIGPASDGRLKPDLAHFWDLTLAPASGGGYTEFGGTSGATPITAGYAGLMMQMWSNGIFGNSTTGNTVFENRPHFTTAKALLVNTATQWAFSGAAHDLTRVHQGWGRVDLKRLYELRGSIFVVNEDDLLTQNQSKVYSLTVPSGSPEFRATMTWADPPALPAAGIHRVNDLTLRVTAPDGTIYFGNNGLAAGQFSTPGGNANTIDTLENVYVANPTPGTWTVEVRADELAQDGHLETGLVDADFALVVSGIKLGVANQAPTATFSAPANNSVVSGIFSLKATAADADGSVVRVRFGLPDGSFVDDTSVPFSTDIDTAGMPAGAAQFTAVAFDDKGASSAVATLTVTVSNVANAEPVVSVSVPPSPMAGPVTFLANASDADGTVAKVVFTLPNAQLFEDTAAPFEAPFDTTTVADGTYVVSAVAIDNLGASSAVASVTVTIVNETSNCAQGQFVANSLPLSIPDNNTTGVSVPVNVVGAGRVGTVKVSLNIAHTYKGDLTVELVSPSGSSVLVSNRAGGSADNLILVDQTVNGLSGDVAGTWTLRVKDLANADVGIINSFSLNVVGDCSVVTGWKASASPQLPIVDNTTTCHTVEVSQSGDASAVKLSFSVEHSYRRSLRVRLVHGATNVTVIAANTLPTGQGTVSRSAVPVAGFSGSATGPWQLCVDEVDAFGDRGTLTSWVVGSN